MSFPINPDIANQVTTVGVVKATHVVVAAGGIQHLYAVLERVTRPNIIIENVTSHSTYSGPRTVEEALEVIHDTYRDMP